MTGHDEDALVAHASLPPADVQARERGTTYARRLAERAERRRSTLCAGIDPTPETLRLLSDDALDSRATHAAAIERFASFLIESVRDHAVAVKPQLAWFELAGWQGMRALERTVAYARTAGLLVLLDAKRGDVPHSAAGYAQAWLGADAGSGAGGDALTVHGSVGGDALAAMAEVAHARGCQVYSLVHTSNPGAVPLQGAQLADGRAWWELLAADVEAAGAGAVVGATHPEVLHQARAAMPNAPLLLPGIGAQGASVDDISELAPGDAPPPLVAASRALLPAEPCTIGAFRQHVSHQAEQLAAATRVLAGATPGRLEPR
jgi:orotidine-5'-phosphate decarboxylase